MEKAAKSREGALQAALAGSALGVAILDLEGRFLEVNEAYARMSGVPAETLRGKRLSDVFHDGDEAAQAAAAFEKLARGDVRTVQTEWRHKLADGRVLWQDITANRLPAEGDQPDRIVVVSVDLTERKRVEGEIERLKRQNDLILNAVTEGVVGVDDEGRITFINEAGARLLGYRPAEIVGKERHALLHHSRAEGVSYPEAKCPIHATLHDGSVHHASGEVFWRKDGKPLPVDYTSAPIREGGRLVGAAIIFADVSDRAQAEVIAKRANKRVLEIYERIPEAFFALDRDFRLVYMNPVAEKMRRTPKEAVLGQVLWEAFPDLKGTRFDAEYHRAMKDQVTVHVEEHYPRMGMWFEATAYPSDEGLSIYFRDITLRKRIEEEAKAASISRPLVRRIVQDLVETGGVAHQILQQVGRKLAADNPSESIGGFLKAYTDMGLGKVDIEKEEGQRYAFQGADLLEKRPGSRVATCSFTLGYLSEAVSKVHRGEPTLGTEIECQSRGAPHCRFIVQVKKPEEGLARRVKELV